MASGIVPRVSSKLFDNTDVSQDIAPTYYNLEEFKKGEIKTALQRTVDKMRRREAINGGKSGKR